jgi:hypothetical protein
MSYQSRSLRMELASRLVVEIKLSNCGMQQLGSQSVSPCGVTLDSSTQPLSRRMGLASFLVHGIGLSGSGMQRLGSRCRITLKKTVQHPSCMTITSHIQQRSTPHPTVHIMVLFPSHQTRGHMHCATLLSYSQTTSMTTTRFF